MPQVPLLKLALSSEAGGYFTLQPSLGLGAVPSLGQTGCKGKHQISCPTKASHAE